MGEGFEHLDVYYFSPTEEMDENTCFILNTRISEIKDQFTQRMESLFKTNQVLEKKIQIFEKINAEDSGTFIPFKEMNPKILIKKLSLLTQNAREIWDSFDEFYGHGFFQEVIEQEYALNPTFHSSIEKQYNERIADLQKQANLQISTLNEKYSKEINFLKGELVKKSNELLDSRQKREQEVAKISQMLQETEMVKFKEKENIVYAKFDEEKTELYRKIKKLEREIEKIQNTKLMTRLKLKLMVIKILICRSGNGRIFLLLKN